MHNEGNPLQICQYIWDLYGYGNGGRVHCRSVMRAIYCHSLGHSSGSNEDIGANKIPSLSYHSLQFEVDGVIVSGSEAMIIDTNTKFTTAAIKQVEERVWLEDQARFGTGRAYVCRIVKT